MTIINSNLYSKQIMQNNCSTNLPKVVVKHKTAMNLYPLDYNNKGIIYSAL